MTPRPGPAVTTGPVFLPGLPHRHGFSPRINGVDASRPCAGDVCGARSIDAGNRRHRASRGALFDGGNPPLAGVSSTVELTLDDLFGQLNQHLFGSQIRQILKSPHQSQ